MVDTTFPLFRGLPVLSPPDLHKLFPVLIQREPFTVNDYIRKREDSGRIILEPHGLHSKNVFSERRCPIHLKRDQAEPLLIYPAGKQVQGDSLGVSYHPKNVIEKMFQGEPTH